MREGRKRRKEDGGWTIKCFKASSKNVTHRQQFEGDVFAKSNSNTDIRKSKINVPILSYLFQSMIRK